MVRAKRADSTLRTKPPVSGNLATSPSMAVRTASRHRARLPPMTSRTGAPSMKGQPVWRTPDSPIMIRVSSGRSSPMPPNCSAMRGTTKVISMVTTPRATTVSTAG